MSADTLQSSFKRKQKRGTRGKGTVSKTRDEKSPARASSSDAVEVRKRKERTRRVNSCEASIQFTESCTDGTGKSRTLGKDKKLKKLLKSMKKLEVQSASSSTLPQQPASGDEENHKQKKQRWNRKDDLKQEDGTHNKNRNNIIDKEENPECKHEMVLKTVVKNEKDVTKPKRLKDVFPDYIPMEDLQMHLERQCPNTPKYVEGTLRINPKYYKHAYLSMPNGEQDLLIIGLRDRNRALERDVVVASIHPENMWYTSSDGQKQRTGTVVCILEKVHPRKAVGHLRKHDTFVLLHPRDQRVPLVKILPKSLPKLFKSQPDLYGDTLFSADIVKWDIPYFAIGKIEKMIGSIGDLQAETTAILLENNLDVTPYHQNLMEDLPSSEYIPLPDDIKDREDWRESCVFTIDPATAVDLDDAVSCTVLDNGNYEVGVHISDVTHYLKFFSPLDIQVAERATTIYLTDNVYHMLPKALCQVCSLLPGHDKLAFSVIWEMSPDAQIIKHRFAKTVINSCCQMSYDQAQMIIENPENKWSQDFLSISGNFTTAQLSKVVNNLFMLATQLRDKRFADGALRIDYPKLHVNLDKVTGLPISYCIEEQKDSNRLIEEFMLLANMTVATYLHNTIPETALLRNHKEPFERVLIIMRDMLQKFGIHLDIDSSSSLHSSIKRYAADLDSDCEQTRLITKYRMMVINTLCFKAMTRAMYKCSSTISDVDELRHYALNVPLYTHFTSPIRRYSDCIVHRLLNACISGAPLPESWTSKLCAKIAMNCSMKKLSAKMAQEQSSELYFTYFIKLEGPVIATAIVLDVKEHSIDVILCDVGIKVRVYLQEIEEPHEIEYSTECSVATVTVRWEKPDVSQVINTFTLVQLRVEKHPQLFRLHAVLLPPRQGI